MSGYSRRLNMEKATTPKIMSSKFITVAKTGRFTDTSDNNMA